MRQQLKQDPNSRNPVHCAYCIQSMHTVPATWLVTGPGAKSLTASLAACNDHVDLLERHGVLVLQPAPKGKKHPL